MRRLALGKLDRRDPKRPDIGQLVVAFAAALPSTRAARTDPSNQLDLGTETGGLWFREAQRVVCGLMPCQVSAYARGARVRVAGQASSRIDAPDRLAGCHQTAGRAWQSARTPARQVMTSGAIQNGVPITVRRRAAVPALIVAATPKSASLTTPSEVSSRFPACAALEHTVSATRQGPHWARAMVGRALDAHWTRIGRTLDAHWTRGGVGAHAQNCRDAHGCA